ncbi:MAG: hypothetical protein IKT58_01615, partial [Oscillospiraceae bacterium]|nr:hypothetical protein [Oscillospiraceae bacterium]
MKTKQGTAFGKKIISVLLVFVLLLQPVSAAVIATENRNVMEELYVQYEDQETLLMGETENSENTSYNPDPADIVCEIETLRGESSKHFRMEDGSFTAIQYNTAVHYENEDGRWEDIDNTLQSVSTFSGNEIYTTENGDITTYFSSGLEEGDIFAIYSEEYGLRMHLPLVSAQETTLTTDATAEIPHTQYNPHAVAMVSDGDAVSAYSRSEASFIPQNLSSTILYEDVFAGVDLQYDLFGYNVKESIIVKSLRDSYSFDFLLDTDGLTATLESNGSVSLKNEEGKLVYEIPAPYMIDAEGEYSDAVTYTLTQVGENTVLLTVTADGDWISQGSLPVTIDPTVVKFIDSVADTKTTFRASSIASGYPNTSYGGSQILYVGYTSYNNTGEHQIVAHVDGLPAIPVNSVITAAALNLYYYEFSNNSNYTYSIIQAHEYQQDKGSDQSYTQWIDNLTWNKVHPNGSASENVGELIDFVKVNAATNQSYITLDLTKSVRKSKSFNMILKTDSGSNKKIDNVLFAYNNQNYIAVSYLNDVGVEDRFTYQAHSAGRAGTVYISDLTQRVTLVNPVISSASDILPFTLSLVYNSSQHGEYFGQAGNTKSNLYARDYSNMKIGTGWKLSAQRCVQSVHIGGDDINTLFWVYTDADGTEHYFREDNGVFRDEEGMKLKMESVPESGHTNFKMTDEVGNETYFRDGLVAYDKDVYGNGIYYVYNNASFSASVASATSWMPTNTVSNRLTAIYRVIKGGTAERLAAFGYNANGFLTTITDEAGRVTQLTPTVVSGITYLSSVTNPDGFGAKYFYSQVGMVGNRDLETNLGFRYAYDADGTVNRYSSVYYLNQDSNYTSARIISCWNGDGNRSSYRDWGEDLTEGTEDDIRLELIFDNVGRTVCQYATDGKIKEILGTTSLAYTTNQGTSKANNKILSSGASGMTAVNLLKDGSVETDGIWTNRSTANATAQRQSGTNGETVHNGQYALSLTVSEGAGTSHYAAITHSGISLTAGETYTLSAYVKAPRLGITWGSGGKLNMILLNSSGSTVKTVTVLDTLPSQDIENGWQRVQGTFTVTTSGTYQPGFLLQGVVGVAYIDDVQLEQSETASVYNLVQNGSFEYDSTHWNWGTQNTLVSSGNLAFGDTVLRATSPYNGIARAQQIIPMYCSADTTFRLSGWAKGESAPHPSGEYGDTKRFFGLFLRIDYTDDTMEFHSVPFEWSNRDWQYVTGNIVPECPEKTIKEIRVFCAYDNNYGYAYFDNISLRREPVTTYSYDDEGRLISALEAGSKKDDRQYNGIDLTKYTAPNKVVYEYTYNDKHQTESVSSDGVQTTYDYDTTTGRLLGSRTQATSGAGASLQTSSTAVTGDPNHTASVTDVNGSVVNYAYTSDKELILSVTDGRGNITNYGYDANNDRVGLVYQSGIAAVIYNYEKSLLSSLTRKAFVPSENNRTIWQQYSFASNQWGQQTEITVKGSADGSTWDAGISLATYEYDPRGGNLVAQSYGNGHEITFEYDILDRLVKESYNDTEEYITYSYTAEGNVGKISHFEGNGTLIRDYIFEYDSLGRLIRSKEKNSDGTVLQTEHLYDVYNRLTQQRWDINGKSYLEEYRYNDPTTAGGRGDGSLKALHTATNQWIYYSYDGLKRLATSTVKNTSNEELFRTTYAYNTLSEDQTSTRTRERTMRDSSDNLIAGYQYTYDAVGNITQIRQAEGNGNLLYAYTYDSLNELVTEQHYDGNGDQETNLTASYTYTYDTAGNIRTESKTLYTGTGSTTTTKTYTYGNGTWQDLLTAVNGAPIAYEGQTYSNGTVTGQAISGNPIYYTNGAKTYTNLTWEHGRQLASITTGTGTSTYDYDAEGIRTRKIVDGVPHTYVTLNGRVVQESFPYGGSTVILLFTYDEQGRPFSLWQSTNGGSSYSQYYYATNAQGDVEGIFFTRKNTETGKQEIVWMGHYTYDAWGNIISVTSPNGTTPSSSANLMNRNPLRYRGYYYDTETGFYYLQSRYYDPAN